MALNRPDNVDTITLETLVGCNGNWWMAYVYNNFGDNILMLLPMLELDHLCAESYINSACLTLCQGTFEEATMVDQWLKDHPNTPFITYVKNGDIPSAWKSINDILESYRGDFDKFLDDDEMFNEWRKVVYYVSCTENGDTKVCYEGYKSLIEEAKKLVDSMK